MRLALVLLQKLKLIYDISLLAGGGEGGREGDAATQQGVFAVFPNLSLGCTWLGKGRVAGQAGEKVTVELPQREGKCLRYKPVLEPEIPRAGGQVALRSVR